MTQEISDQLSEAAKAMSRSVARPVKPDHGLCVKTAAFLEKKGWSQLLAGENFKTGVFAICLARANHKGLFVYGDTGTGKTSFLKCFQYFDGKRIECIDLRDPVQARRINREETGDFWKNYLEANILLDDLGAEAAGNDYGRQFEPAWEFIESYMNLGQGHLFITSNLKPDRSGIENDPNDMRRLRFRYGSRVEKLNEFVYFAEFVTNSNPGVGRLREPIVISPYNNPRK